MSANENVGFVVLAHHYLHRTAELVAALSDHGAKIVVHIDEKCNHREFAWFAAKFSSNSNVILVPRTRCTWGMFSLTAATLESAALLFQIWPNLAHVCHLSGDTIPVRPIKDFLDFLGSKPGVDIIETVPVADGSWVVGGLGVERFKYWFALPWRSQRRLFDIFVAVQRRLKIRRRIPNGLVPSIGSQWWCLTGETLRAILHDPERRKYDRYFKWAWIPDESYFQTLARKHSRLLESRSVVLSRFDSAGIPYIYYDDHQHMLAASGALFARKIWHDSPKLYHRFLLNNVRAGRSEPAHIGDATSAKELKPHRGRAGLIMQGRFPGVMAENAAETAGRYHVFCGFDHWLQDFPTWIGGGSNADVHGHLFAESDAEFSGGAATTTGCLQATARLRDYDPRQYLRNLLWARRSKRQSFMFGADDNRDIAEFIARDANCHLYFLQRGWLFELFKLRKPADDVYRMALSATESERRLARLLASASCKANVRTWDIEDAIKYPAKVLMEVKAAVNSAGDSAIQLMPKIESLDGFDDFVGKLRNLGVPGLELAPYPLVVRANLLAI